MARYVFSFLSLVNDKYIIVAYIRVKGKRYNSFFTGDI